MKTNFEKLLLLAMVPFSLFLTVLPASAQTSINPSTGQPALPQPTPYQVIERGANHNVWQRTTYETSPSGKAVAHVHQYQELATGLNYLKNGKYVPSKEEIDILPGGTAEAIQGQHQAYFPGNIFDGEIELVTPDGVHLKSRPLGLSYDDGSNTVLIAELTNSIGYVVGSNQVIYPDAFVGVDADLRYTYTKAGFEQDIILREQPPTPESFGLNSQNARLQVLTEFFGTANPGQITSAASRQNGLSDTMLTFGKMKMVRGKAFSFGDSTRNSSRTGGTPVYKSWQYLEGRTFLVEEVPLPKLASQLEQLPAAANAGTTLNSASPMLHKISATRLLPPVRLVQSGTNAMRLARNEVAPKSGVVLDYQTIISDQTDFTFQGDMTYYVNGEYNLLGTTTIEGGTVVKLGGSGQIDIDEDGTIVCDTAAYRPAIFTSVNDNTVGETISGSSGSPAMGDVYVFMNFNPTNVLLHNVRFSYCALAIVDESSSNMVDVSDSQFVSVEVAVYGYNIELLNVLVSHYETAVVLEGPNLIEEQVTVDNGWQCIWPDYPSALLSLTNCLFTRFSNFIPVGSPILQTNSVVCSASLSSPVFQTVGGGNYYLTNNSPYRNAGTTNIDPVLLAELSQKTTYPPIVYPNTSISVNTTLSPVVQRDTDTPDLGYHYDPIDYAFGGVDLYTNLNITAGTVVGWFETYGGVYSSGQPYGISLNNKADLAYQGTVTDPCWMVKYDTVQESPWTGNGWMGGIMLNGSGSGNIPQINAHFAKWSSLDNDSHFRDNWAPGEGTFSDCEFYVSGIATYDQSSLDFSNCLFYRTATYFFDQDTAINFTYQNCAFYNGFIAMARYSGQPASLWIIRDTTFDGTGFSASDNYNGNTNYTAFDYNAYNTNNLSGLSFSYPYTPQPTNTLEDIGQHDVFMGDYNWQSSWFGDFYLPSDSPLIDFGSTTADQVELYHFTTQTNQTVEGISTVDIGYHYVATDAYGNPLDSNGDEVPDYIEDANGNGVVDSGETNWTLAIITEPSGQTVMQGSNATFTVTAGGVPPLSYQWYWDGAPLSDEAGVSGSKSATLNLSGVNPDQAGSYYVVVANSFGSVTSAPLAVLTVLLSGTNRYDTLPAYIMPPYAYWNVADISDPAQPVNIGELQEPFSKPDYDNNHATVPPPNTPWHTNNSLPFTEAFGTTASGGVGEGTVFKIDPAGPPQGMFPNELVQCGNKLYGTTEGLYGTYFNGYGTIFSVNTNGSGFTNLYSFNEVADPNDGWQPRAGLVLSGNTLYGTTYSGGNGYGTVFSFNITNGTFTHLHDFTGTSGANPVAKLILCGNTLYGTTSSGGTDDKGTVFEIDTGGDDSSYHILHYFAGATDGEGPDAALLLSGGVLYGTTPGGGAHSLGTVFSVNTNGDAFATLHSFGGADGSSEAGLAISGSALYGTTEFGGANGDGTVFSINTNGADYTILHSFNESNTNDGDYPAASLTLAGTTLYGTTFFGGTDDYGTVFSININGSGYTNLYSFQNGSDGELPDTALALAGDTLYGTTYGGSDLSGGPNYGTIFSINTNGTDFKVLSAFSTFAVIHTFNGLDGASPCSQLALSGSAFYGIPTTVYGTTFSGGTYGYGTIFRVNTDGSGFTNLYEFTGGSDGGNPQTGLLISGNTLYGTTTNSIFKIDTDGSDFTCLTNIDGASQLILSLSGDMLYGTTSNGGLYHYGNMFRINTDGSGFTSIYNFTGGAGGAYPGSGLELYGVGNSLANGSTNCVLYGTTYGGGANNDGMVFSITNDGTGFTDLHDFDSTNDGAYPLGGLLVTNNNNNPNSSATYLVGTTSTGGANGGGTVFGMNLDGSGFKTLYSFGGAKGAGANPEGKLAFIGTTLYGTTSAGGADTNGMVFSINSDGTDFNDLYDFSDGGTPLAGLTLTVADNPESIWSLDTTINVSAENVTNLSYSIAIDNGYILFVNGNFVQSYYGGEAQWSPYLPLPDLHQGENNIRVIIGGDDDPTTSGDYFAMAIKSAFTNTLYGTTYAGGSNGGGTVFKISPDGYETLYSFSNSPDGQNPVGDLVLSGNTLYGVTQNGGTNNYGTLFSISTNGSDYKMLYSFTNTPDGAYPVAGLILSGNTLYGTTENGGDANGDGTIFRINTDGSGYTTLYKFAGGNDGQNPEAPLVLAGNTLYGTTYSGGAYSEGAIFCISTNGSNYQMLYSFNNGPDGKPEAGLTLSGGTLYGTTYYGGTNNLGTIFSISTNGMNYQTLHSFTNTPDGANPRAGLTLSGSTLYGTTYNGGAVDANGNGDGTIFRIGIDGSGYTNLLSFGSFDSAYGKNPQADLLIQGNTLYGTVYQGGAINAGMVFGVNTNGTDFNDIYDFQGQPDGKNPKGGLCSP